MSSADKFAAMKKAVEEGKEERVEEYTKIQEQQAFLSEQMRRTSLSDEDKQQILQGHAASMELWLRNQRRTFNTDDFRSIKVIGQGAFGVVRIVQLKETGEFFALKQMPKDKMTKKNQRARVMSEKDLLSSFEDTQWVIALYSTFQDPEYLYMLMEFLPGGDMMSHLIRLNTFDDKMTKFYMAELVLAVDAVHKMGFVHRDIKPDNIVFTKDGHLKLLDFGLCRSDPSLTVQSGSSNVGGASTAGGNSGSQDQEEMASPQAKARPSPAHLNRNQLKSSVGTPQYMAPEVFKQKYDHMSDWWSVGIIMYECLVGGVPFYTSCRDPRQAPRRIMEKILKYKENLYIPYPGIPMSKQAEDLLKNVLTDAHKRFGVEEIKSHPFFAGVIWDKLHLQKPPIKPEFKDYTDTSNFKDLDLRSKDIDLPKYVPSGIKKDKISHMECVIMPLLEDLATEALLHTQAEAAALAGGMKTGEKGKVGGRGKGSRGTRKKRKSY